MNFVDEIGFQKYSTLKRLYHFASVIILYVFTMQCVSISYVLYLHSQVIGNYHMKFVDDFKLL